MSGAGERQNFFIKRQGPGFPSPATSGRSFGILVAKLAAEMPFESDD
jgi:hypothetical protein